MACFTPKDVALPDIAAAVGTPFYCYSTATLTRHYTVFARAFESLDASSATP
jgi:diaminopimelate decarboxylase